MARSFSQGAYNDRSEIPGLAEAQLQSLYRALIPWEVVLPDHNVVRRERELGATYPGEANGPPRMRKYHHRSAKVARTASE